MNPDASVFTAALLSTIASYMDPIVDAPAFWVCIGALLAILSMVVVGMAIVWAAERNVKLPGER